MWSTRNDHAGGLPGGGLCGPSVIGAVLTVAVLIGRRYDETLWGWLKLLVVPAVIAGGGIWFLPGEWRCSGLSRSSL
jgi:hypothetical protein